MPDQSLVLTILPHPVTDGADFLITAVPARTQLIHLSAVDVLIIAVYFAMVLFIGFYVKSGVPAAPLCPANSSSLAAAVSLSAHPAL